MTDYPFIRGSHNCCATLELAGFYGGPKEIDLVLAEKLNERHDYTAILTNAQFPHYEPVLRKHGFRLAANWTNRVHADTTKNLFLFIRGFSDDKQEADGFQSEGVK